MRITIDTKEDSYEDIRKVLHLLTNVLERKGEPIEIQTNKPAEIVDTTNIMSMFSDPATKSGDNLPDRAPDFSALLNLNNKNKEEDKIKEQRYKIELF
ncbi:MAG: hypothetical protein ABH824_03735 [Nanoarchaeota archaeon]|nr:hypothetical protein [Nanoarchaeota archaeon]MBU1631855.1 hypothetical protein [Nanoarchaeota archaeon]MBU1875848.1 hypothetical protein [Nanoarchaeota archaeon]